jgi:DNA-binding transcriptional ArsR family regulator
MNDNASGENAGWAIGQSIALELDMALTAVSGYFSLGELPEDFAALVRAIPPDWRGEWPSLLGETKGLVSILEPPANLAGVLLDTDYRRATLAVRELTMESALAQLADQARPLGLIPKVDLPPAEALVDLGLDLMIALYTDLGFEMTVGDQRARRLRQDMIRVVRILRDGDLHTRFWHWLDRFYYEFYRPWRQTRVETLDMLEKRAVTALGAQEKTGTPPEMAWLSAQSPLLRYPDLGAAVRAGRLRVYFWVEPFGLQDTWSLQPGLVIVSFAEPGALYQNFQAFAGDVAARTKALADPTRLIILRLIRHFGMVNTEIAAYLDLARPTVSIHAKILREAGLIRSQQEGRLVRHEIVPEEVRRLFADLERFLDLPDGEA